MKKQETYEYYYLYCSGIEIMKLSYKPNINDLIKNDASGLFYEVVNIEGVNCTCNRVFSMY